MMRPFAALFGSLLSTMMWVSGAHAQTDTVTYMHTDGIGSVRMLTNESAQVIVRFDYLPFGEPCTSACGTSASTATTRQFTSQEKDTESLLDYFGARYYRNLGGRFITVDPDHVAGNLFDPQRWNAYAYARNNPLTFVDWLGLAPCPPDTNGSTCVEGTAGTGEVVFDIWFLQLRAAARNWWASHQPENEPEVKGASPFGPLGLRGLAGGAQGLRALPSIVAKNGTRVTGLTRHGVNRAIGDTASRAGTKPQAILDALKNPQRIVDGIDSKGRPFQVFFGENARVVVNPQTGRIISTNPLSAAGAQ
jgi:RHS repeat-associated protein